MSRQPTPRIDAVLQNDDGGSGFINALVREGRDLEVQLAALEKSIADLTHPNLAELLTKLNAREEDLRLAAGELKVPMPEAGTDMARLLSANILLRYQRDEARGEIEVHKAFGKVAVAERNLAWHREDKLKAQRDELLAALEKMIHLCEHDLGMDEESPYIEQARAAIANQQERQ